MNREICLSISGHHEETWQPAWGIRTALWALRAFMEGDAKGQVGGMDMPVTERERLAEESRGWRCRGCGGRRNEDILREEGGEEGKHGGKIDVPEELKFGFRDQMEASKEERLDKGKGKEVVTETSGQQMRSQGQESKPQIREQVQQTQQMVAPTVAAAPVPRTVQPLRPTRTVAPLQQTTSVDGVPAWVDKAITGVVAALALLIIKKILV